MSSHKQLYGLLTVLCMGAYFYLSYQWIYPAVEEESYVVCPIKAVTDIPCPSCGSTRSVLSIMHGDFVDGFLLNPLGYMLFGALLVIPFWLLADVILKKRSLYHFTNKMIKVIAEKPYSIILISLILLNWIWNINKGL